MFKPLAQDLFLVEDICNVYILRHENKGIAINFGTGSFMPSLKEIGIAQLEMIFLTDHNYGHSIGLIDYDKSGSKIIAPQAEVHLLREASEFWQQRRVFLNYDLGPYFPPPLDVDQVRGITDKDSIKFGSWTIKIIDTPGSTKGAVSYLIENKCQSYLFIGNLLYSNEKLPNLYDVQWEYMPEHWEAGGSFKTLIDSLIKLVKINPQKLLPSQGNPFTYKRELINRLIEKIDYWRELLTPKRISRKLSPLHKVLPNLVYLDKTSWAIISNDGYAFIIDYGYIEEEIIEKFQKEFSVQKIDVITITHYHDDHIARIPELQHRFGSNNVEDIFMETEIWVHEDLLSVLRQPGSKDLPCIYPIFLEYDRIIEDCITIHWKGFDLTFQFQPGQTKYSMALFTNINGYQVAFCGDNVWPLKEGGIKGPVIFKNEYELGTYQNLAKQLMEHKVEIILGGHYDPIYVENQDLVQLHEWAEEVDKTAVSLLPKPTNLGIDPFWTHFYPYYQQVCVGKDFKLTFILKNYCQTDLPIKATLIFPDGFQVLQGSKMGVLNPDKDQNEFTWNIRAPVKISVNSRHVITLNLEINNRKIFHPAIALIHVLPFD